MFKDRDAFLKFFADGEVDSLDLKFVDLMGRWHHLSLHPDQVSEKIFTGGIGFDGSSIPGYTSTESGDLVLIPDVATAFIDPFWEERVLSVICWIHEAGSVKPYIRDPRGVFNRALNYLKEMKIADETQWNPELEFYIFDRVEYDNHSNVAHHRVFSQEAEWDQDVTTGHKVHLHGGYHAIPPEDQIYVFRQKMVDHLTKIGVKVKYHHHEVGGPGQCEIEYPLTPGMEAADAILIGKYVIKMVMFRHGKSATFMPKPLHGEAGNGLHFHMLLKNGGEPIFYDAEGYAGLSKTCLSFMAGLLSHGRSLTAITNPSTNSFKRLIPGFEAPSNLFFSVANRSAAIRIPKYATEPHAKRFEYRPPDATCNPYLAMAGMLMAGAGGVLKSLDPTALGFGPYKDNFFADEELRKGVQPLPSSLREALGDLSGDHDFLLEGDVFTRDIIKTWLDLKEKECDEIQRRPHPYEFHLYYTA